MTETFIKQQHDDHCVIIYQNEAWRITRIHNGVFDLKGLHYCPGCQDYHENFVKLSDKWCKSYADNRYHIVCHHVFNDEGEFVSLH